ncbi:F-BAR and double SH3 domains protein 2-like [Simochromis diagramma]|uniref:F-BAR and double SH3 domains protein 2-like n=1 Tax=Simochromis diagramma TaxID=43689 RepID=UPI001A7E9C4F|nr:F-BAR and double SH3 domains protein 2-like [Simochromis diagramma]
MQVLQEFHQQLFVQKNMAFQQAPDFMFQPVDSDTARNRSGQVGYVPEKYLQLPSSNSLLISFAKALYDYAGQTEDELSFPEGAIIRILSRETHEDDGFWEGEFNSVVGVVPAVLVEDLTVTSESGDGQRDGSAQASPSTLSQCERSPRGPFQPGPLHSSPLQTPTVSSPVSSPCSATASPIGRPPSYHNGHHRLPPAPHKSPFHSPAQSSPQPPKYPESGGGTIRPVRAAPPPPKQHPHGQVKRREEVDHTGVKAAPPRAGTRKNTPKGNPRKLKNS